MIDDSLLRILLVDDDEAFAAVAKDILMMSGRFTVETASSAYEALRRLAEGSFDVVVADYEVPGKDGLELLADLRRSGSDVPFILFTGKGREEVAVKALNLGADGYCSKHGKPEVVYGELVHLICLAVERARAKAALRESEKRYRTIMECNPLAIFVHDLDGRMLDANQQACRSLGYTREELLTLSIADIDPDADKLGPKFWPKALAGETITFESLHKRKDGTTFPVEVHMATIKLDEKTAIIGLATNITQRKKTQEALLKSEQRFREFADSLPEIVFETDTEGKITYVNKTARETLGFATPEIIGKHAAEFIAPRDRARAAQNIQKILQGEQSTGNAYQMLKKDGTTFPVMVYSKRAVAENGKPYLRGIIINITELKKTTEKLAILNEKLNVVGGLTRHDLRNKLAAIAGQAYLLQKKMKETPEVTQITNKIITIIEQAERILDFSRVYEKMGMEQLQPINVKSCFEAAAVMFPELQKIQLTNQLDNLTVIADTLLTKVFYNLIDNTLKHGKKATKISITYTQTPNQTTITYEDNGIGIPQTEKQKIFQNPTKTPMHGLYLVQKIMGVYGWTITENGEPGKGAKFTITIPHKPT
ncbi:MAG: PAS domain S-box protein [Candidatus Bathyarchaeia archaeon]